MTSIILFLSIEKILQVWGRRTKGERGSDERKHLLGLKSREAPKGLLGSQRPHTPQTVLEQVVFAPSDQSPSVAWMIDLISPLILDFSFLLSCQIFEAFKKFKKFLESVTLVFF